MAGCLQATDLPQCCSCRVWPVGNGHDVQDANPHVRHEQEEVTVVHVADAIVEPRAVVVHTQYTAEDREDRKHANGVSDPLQL